MNDARKGSVKLTNYQKYVIEFAKKSNCICFLETGAGKTMIAVELIRYFLSKSSRKGTNTNKRYCVFLAPTNPLVQQQFKIFESELNVECLLICGENNKKSLIEELGIDRFKNVRVFIMTPMIFMDMLTTQSFNMEDIELIIFDECHHQRKDDIVYI